MLSLLPWYLDGRAQQNWIWDHPGYWVLIVVILIPCLGGLTALIIKHFRN